MKTVENSEKFIKAFATFANLLMKDKRKFVKANVLMNHYAIAMNITEEQARKFSRLLADNGYIELFKSNDIYVIALTKKACELIRLIRKHNEMLEKEEKAYREEEARNERIIESPAGMVGFTDGVE